MREGFIPVADRQVVHDCCLESLRELTLGGIASTDSLARVRRETDWHMFQVEPTMVRIGEALKVSQQGDREGARRLLSGIWADIGQENGDALYRCALAHAMADVQDDVADELLWDLRALEAADGVTDARAAAAGIEGSVRGFYPSLHLNVGESYRKLGDFDAARRHLEKGLAASDVLADDGYGRMIRAGLERLRIALG